MSTATQELEQGAEDLKDAAAAEAEAVQKSLPDQELSADQEQLFANADERRDLRRKADKVELRLAFRELTDGVRGLIRVAPLTAVLAGIVVGVGLGKRSRTRRAPTPPLSWTPLGPRASRTLFVLPKSVRDARRRVATIWTRSRAGC